MSKKEWIGVAAIPDPARIHASIQYVRILASDIPHAMALCRKWAEARGLRCAMVAEVVAETDRRWIETMPTVDGYE